MSVHLGARDTEAGHAPRGLNSECRNGTSERTTVVLRA